jgi:hypothetical protein
MTPFVSLEVGIILCVIGCYATASFLPGLFPAVIAYLMLVGLCPTGKMMISHAGGSEDPQIYREPG